MSVSPSGRPQLRPRPGNLREAAEKIEVATGLRAQIVGGKLVPVYGNPPRRSPEQKGPFTGKTQ